MCVFKPMACGWLAGFGLTDIREERLMLDSPFLLVTGRKPATA